jgi:hypothetical protein
MRAAKNKYSNWVAELKQNIQLAKINSATACCRIKTEQKINFATSCCVIESKK